MGVAHQPMRAERDLFRHREVCESSWRFLFFFLESCGPRV